MTAKRKGWGGKRAGSGRKKVVDDPVRLAIDLERKDGEALKNIASSKGMSLAEFVRATLKARITRGK